MTCLPSRWFAVPPRWMSLLCRRLVSTIRSTEPMIRTSAPSSFQIGITHVVACATGTPFTYSARCAGPMNGGLDQLPVSVTGRPASTS